MAFAFTVTPSREPGWLHWQPLSPLVAAAGLWFFGRVWHYEFSWPVWAALVVSAWAGALVAHASREESGQASRPPLLVAAALAVVAALVALRWLPRGLVISAVPIAGVAIIQALISLGNRRPWARRLAVAGAAFVALGVIVTGLSAWPPSVRAGLLLLAVILSWSMWKAGPNLAVAETPLVVARGLLFAAGVLLPIVWWSLGTFLGEIARPDNLAFVLLAIVAAACRSEWRKPTPSLKGLAACAGVSIVLTGVSAFEVCTTPSSPVRGVFLGVGTSAFLLTLGLGLGFRRVIPAQWQRLVPDLAWAGLAVIALWPAATEAR